MIASSRPLPIEIDQPDDSVPPEVIEAVAALLLELVEGEAQDNWRE